MGSCCSSVVAPAPSLSMVSGVPAESSGQVAWAGGVRPKSGPGLLTEHQERLIRASWAALAGDLAGLGTRVFVVMFESHPEVKGVFPWRELAGDELETSPDFRRHAAGVMQALTSLVQDLSHLDHAVTPLLNGLGHKHIRFRGFKPTYFNALQAGLAAAWRGTLGQEAYNSDTEEAWSIVFDFIIRELKKGASQAIVDGGAGSEVKDEDID